MPTMKEVADPESEGRAKERSVGNQNSSFKLTRIQDMNTGKGTKKAARLICQRIRNFSHTTLSIITQLKEKV